MKHFALDSITSVTRRFVCELEYVMKVQTHRAAITVIRRSLDLAKVELSSKEVFCLSSVGIW